MANTESMIETFVRFCSKKLLGVSYKERNTNSYNDVHLCRKAQTTASNRQSPKEEWFVDVGNTHYSQTGHIAGL